MALTPQEQQYLEELQTQVAALRENHHERSEDNDSHSRTLYVVLGVSMAVLTMLTVTGIYLMRPGDATMITTITGMTMPLAIALIGYGLQHNIRGVYKLADGNLSAVRRDLNIALTKIQDLQEKRLDEAKRTIPLVTDGDKLVVPPLTSGMIVKGEV